MADGFQGFGIESRRQTAIQRPIGFFGLSIELADAPNLFLEITDSQGRSVRNCSVMAANETSGTPKATNTDAEGNAALKADSTTTITVVNNKFSKVYNYDRSTQGSLVTLTFDVPLIFL